MLAKRLKVSDGGFCGELSKRWAYVKKCQQNLSSSGFQSDSETHSQSDSQTVHDMTQTILFLTTCKWGHVGCNTCPHKCSVCGRMVSQNDQASLSTESQALPLSDHACVDCMLLLAVTTLNMTLTQGELSSDDFHSCHGMTQAMEWCLLKGNQYLAYATCKCVLSSVTADAIRAEELRNFLEKLVQELSSVEDRHAEGETSWRAASILDLFQHLFGSTTEEVKRICVDSLQDHWISLTSRFLQPPDSQISPVALFALLSLWKKVLNVPVAAAWCLEEGRKATSILLQYVTCAKTKGYVRLKTVGLLNKLMAFEMEDRRDKPDGRFYSYEIADQVVDWIQAGRLSEAVCKEGSAVFGWTLADHAPQHTYSTDVLFRRKLALLSLRTISVTLDKHRNEGDWTGLLESVCEFLVCGTGASPSASGLKDLFSEQDDDWVSALLFVLDIHVYLLHRKVEDSAEASDLAKGFNVHHCFRQFLEMMSHDHTVLVDLLSSPETQFLLFLLRYLKLVHGNWQDFVKAHSEPSPDSTVLNQTINYGEGQREVHCKTSASPEGDCKGVEPRFMCSSSLENRDVTAMGTLLSATQHKLMVSSCAASRNQLSSSSPPRKNPLETSTHPGQKLATDRLSPTSLPPGMTAPESSTLLENKLATDSPTSPSRGSPSDGTLQTRHDLLTGCSSNPSVQQLIYDYMEPANDLPTDDKILSGCRKDIQINEKKLDSEALDSNINKTDHSIELSRNTSASPESSSSMEMDMDMESSTESPLLSDHYVVSLDSVDTGMCDTVVDQIMSSLIRLRFGLERLSLAGLFPYNAKPLLKVLQAIEDRYETMDNSEYSQQES